MAGQPGTIDQRCPADSVRWKLGISFCLCLLILSNGCRSRAYQDVYTDQMASELRVLEDQLYEADYQNRMLQQKLERKERLLEEQVQRDAKNSRSVKPLNSPSAKNRSPQSSSEQSSPTSPKPQTDSFDNEVPEIEIDLGAPADDIPAAPKPQNQSPQPDKLPPVQVLPPRAEEFAPPEIEVGEPAPPGGELNQIPLPPGQIPTPESARLLLPRLPVIPASVEIHPGLSGGHHQDSDSEIDGVYLVLTIKDDQGQATRIDKPMSIVMLDSSRQGDEARVGRWNFTEQEVASFYRETPLPSYQIPILWNGRIPGGDEVAVFVRVMASQEAALETDMLIRFRAATTADWQPRGLGTRAAGINPDTVWR